MNAAPTAAPAEQSGTAGRPLPIIAVTMGDGAGVGPEVVVPALLDAEALRGCRPVVIGDAERAARRPGSSASPRHRAGRRPRRGRVHARPHRRRRPRLLPADLPLGVLSAVAGEAAYQYIRVAGELALSGGVQASAPRPSTRRRCTPPDTSSPATPSCSPISPAPRRCR